MDMETTISDTQTTAKRATKDSVFRDLFENPEYLLQLYQALHPEDKITSKDDIGTVTIKNVLLNQMYNDLGFTVGKESPKLMILLEAQSTWTINVLVRIMLYLAESLQEYIVKHNLNVFSTKKIILPYPELYVIYTGKRESRPECLSLAEEFFPGSASCFDLTVRMIYDGREGDIISQYIAFTRVFDEQVAIYGRTRKAVLETIRICEERNILREYFKSRQKEVVSILMTLFDQEYAVERYGDEKLAQGKIEGKIETAQSMKKKGFQDKLIAEILEVSVDVVHQWLANSSSSSPQLN